MSKYDFPYVVISGEQIAPLANPGFDGEGRSEEDYRAFICRKYGLSLLVCVMP